MDRLLNDLLVFNHKPCESCFGSCLEYTAQSFHLPLKAIGTWREIYYHMQVLLTILSGSTPSLEVSHLAFISHEWFLILCSSLAAGDKQGAAASQEEKPACWRWLLVIIAMPFLAILTVVGLVIWLILLPIKIICCPIGMTLPRRLLLTCSYSEQEIDIFTNVNAINCCRHLSQCKQLRLVQTNPDFQALSVYQHESILWNFERM